MFHYRNIFYFLFIAVAVFSFGLANPANAACTAKVLVSLKDYEAKPLINTRFRIYEQIRFGNLIVPGESLAIGTTDQYLGVEEVEFELTDPEINNYALMVENPSLNSADFWYFGDVKVTCDSTITIEKRLESLRVRTRNTDGELQRNVRFSVYSQKRDANNQQIIDQSLGIFNTDNAGQKIVYLPNKEHSLKSTQYYAIGFRSPSGGTYYKYNIEAVSGVVNALDYNFSDLKVMARDTITGDPIPNFRIEVYEEKENNELGEMITRIVTDDLGIAYLQYPPGRYTLQYEEANKSDKSFSNVLINEGKQTTAYVSVDRDSVGKCGVKSTLEVSLRDWNQKIATDMEFSLYQQTRDNNSQAIAGQRVVRGNIDNHGLGQTIFYPLPAERYVLKACHQDDEFGCFWFYDLHFPCNSELFFEKNINSVEIILRNSKGDLAVGQRFKIYQKEVDIDGNLVVNKLKLVNSFTLPGTGKTVVYLSSEDMLKKNQEYIITVDLSGGIQLKDGFKLNNNSVTYLEYMISGNQLTRISKPVAVDNSLVKRLTGRILLQVEEHGEAWYVNPTDSKRYYLGRAQDAFALMKRLSIGVSNNNLKRIRTNVDIVQGKDSDKDGLPDVLEEGLGTDPYRADSDEDGYTDMEEARTGYNYRGNGRLQISSSFSNQQRGRILLQVEGNGEAWYVNPVNSQKYYLNRPDDAYNIMRELGLGITNADLEKILIGSL
ncbi:MAG: hypothetical protein V1865_00940 [bacterium]